MYAKNTAPALPDHQSCCIAARIAWAALLGVVILDVIHPGADVVSPSIRALLVAVAITLTINRTMTRGLDRVCASIGAQTEVVTDALRAQTAVIAGQTEAISSLRIEQVALVTVGEAIGAARVVAQSNGRVQHQKVLALIENDG